MSETCIVCLGDLGEGGHEIPHSTLPGPSDKGDNGKRQLRITAKSTLRPGGSELDLIAHLLPCHHNLHDQCLKPWVERANSCPICRQSFNMVELYHVIGGKPCETSFLWNHRLTSLIHPGPIVSSYPVNDRTQVADVDPSMLMDVLDDDEPEVQPCPICGDDDNEDRLLSCDGCDVEYHTYCVDLEEIPVGPWLCETCAVQQAIEMSCPTRQQQRSHNMADRRTRGQRQRSRNQNPASSWTRVWQSVWDRLNIDLDFPFDEGSSSSQTNRAQRALTNRRDFRQWQRRFQVAERQGGTNRFRETATTLLDLENSQDHPDTPYSESKEELRSWNALDKAKTLQLESNLNKRKKSATSSPSDVDRTPEPARPLKRPRTRRTLDLLESSDASNEASTRLKAARASSTSRKADVSSANYQTNGPSFLQSLLKEVESSAAPDETKGQTRPTLLTTTGRSSPQISSPGASPTTSNHGSPRAMSTTPPPLSATRPGSPFSLTSKVEPIFPPPEFSPVRSPPTEQTLPHRTLPEVHYPKTCIRQPRPRRQTPPKLNHLRSENTSPSRVTMSLAAKSDLQKMVSAALNPHYKNNAISKDQYTDINRNISRMLYDKAGDEWNVNDDSRETWERLASDEVAKAVAELKADSLLTT